jgi:hypothetical protein
VLELLRSVADLTEPHAKVDQRRHLRQGEIGKIDGHAAQKVSIEASIARIGR